MAHTILIVDDDSDDIEITRRLILKSGRTLTVTSAPSGESALKLLQDAEELPSIAFIDLKMFGMSGIDTVRRIRDDERFNRLPLVIMTNSTLETDMQKSYDAGADGFIHKAFDADQFFRSLNAHLDCWLK